MQKKASICCSVLLALLIGRTVYQNTFGQSIGMISGPEYEWMTVDGQLYEIDQHTPFHASDKGHYMGKIDNGDRVYRIYAVRGTADYLYCRWQWEGEIYKKVS